MSAPIKTVVMINGASQYFLRIFKKSQMSFVRSRNASMVMSLENAFEIDVRVFANFSVALRSTVSLSF
jgi:hypothetical protein